MNLFGEKFFIPIVHAIAGITGMLLAGMFASHDFNPSGPEGGISLFYVQGVATLTAILVSFIGTVAILTIINGLGGFSSSATPRNPSPEPVLRPAGAGA
jgi:ammonia channel protein AmtB